MAETTLQLGFVPKNRGEYQSTPVTRYYKDNVVQYNGSSYIADPVGWSESNPTATYVTIAPTDASGNLNAGWRVFASGNNTFTTGEKVDNVGIDDEPIAGSDNLVKSGGVYEKVNQLGQNVNELNLFSGVARTTFIDGYYIALSDPENTISTTPIERNGASYSIVPCKQGENFIISATPLTQIGAQKMYVFTDGNYVCKLRGFIGNQLVDYNVIAPVDGYFIINASANAERIVYKGQLGVSDSLSKSLAKLGNIFAVYGAPETLVASDTESNTIYNISNIYGSTLNNYNTLVYDVRYLDVLAISVSLPSSPNYKLAMFYDANDNFVGFEERHNGQTTQNKEVVVVPKGAVKMRISSISTHLASVEKLVISPSTITPGNQIPKTAILKTDGATISMNTYKIEMTKHGHNNLLDIRRILDSQNNSINLISTDWQGPYIVSAINDADGDAIAEGRTFTGGNHAYSFDGESGTPTGRTIEFHLFADGVEITDLDKPFAWRDYVEIRWKNRIQGWNTKKVDGTGREILEETPSWTFFADGTIKTSNYITALEDVYIYMYYGMQMSVAWMNGGILLPSASRQKINIEDFTPTGLGTQFSGVEVTSLDSHVNITMGYNPFVDLGNGEFIDSSDIQKTRIHTSKSKLYIYMIYKQNLLENNIAHYEGYYRFF